MAHNFHSWKSNQGVTVLGILLGQSSGTRCRAQPGPLAEALCLLLPHLLVPRDRQLKSLVSDARWVTPGLLGTALHYMGTKNQSLSSDVPTHLSHCDPKNQIAFCPNCQPLQQGHFQWIPKMGWGLVFSLPPPAASTRQT